MSTDRIIRIHNLDPVESQVSKQDSLLLKPLLSYEAEYYKQGPWRKVRKAYIKTLLRPHKGSFLFHSGFIPKIRDWADQNNIELKITGYAESIPHTDPSKIKLPGITFYLEQLGLIRWALKEQRGILQAPTGLGKTVVGIAIMQCYPKSKILWLCHTKDLMYQVHKELEGYGYTDAGMVGDSLKETGKRITIATRQSFAKIVDQMSHLYDLVIIDETHHVSGFNGEYAKILSHLVAPVRIGLTATVQTENVEAAMAAEAFLGPVIGKISIEKAQELGLVADVKVKIIKYPVDVGLKEVRKYAEVYQKGVVNCFARNSAIAETAQKHVEKGDSVLIMINEIKHGENILAQVRRLGVRSVFVYGNTDAEARMMAKEKLNRKDIQCVICSVIWNEGVNIPELNVVINAAGGKGEIRTLQRLGRGLRKTKDKDTLVYYDCLDLSHNYLIAHFGTRFALYSEQGWL